MITLEDRIERIYIDLDLLFRAGKFGAAEQVMRAETRDAPIEVLLALLSISSPVPPIRSAISKLRVEIAEMIRTKARDDMHAAELLRGLI